ncbi:GSU2403 family nucleotidyltransferase fold protein [Bradyrhizobium sp. AS23.2]|uniref:GSU2403 family nucleotidyltransferase fold protein n=1 Tax=Bradyrhizobium sp. AS23.2 TaxID=1680155 RepID=UPI00093F0FEE|nr:GSU2403 family nucleotidyltransferase fold protein [Bradyrhizobium sp. AS23.2]OKO70470.1 hypothetical protein AC630_34900 [Bradyrhizobium sp. AS23.2]
MAAELVPFSDEETRVLVNLEQQYEVWIEAERALARLPYNLKWKTIQGKDYLYNLIDRTGNAKSLGRRSSENEAKYEAYQTQKAGLITRRNESRGRLDETCRLYRALRLPMIPSEAAEILREADRRSLLGSHLLVIGTNAVPAYFIEASGRIMNAPSETNDFDLAWTANESDEQDNPVWAMLKSVDGTYTVNTEKPFQARNAKAYEVELLVAPSRAATLGKRDQPKPFPLHEQEWLLRGRFVTHVVVGRDATPARMTVPDPRWFALQKLWMSRQEKRNPLKRPKDAKQGMALLTVIRDYMPLFKMDAAFEQELPNELRSLYEEWKWQHETTSEPRTPLW